MRRCMLYTPAAKGIMLEYAAHLASTLRLNQVNVVLQTGRDPEWPRDLPAHPSLVSNLELPSKRVKYGSLWWAMSRYKMALVNAIRGLALAREVEAQIVHLQLVLPWVDVAFIPLHKRRAKVICTVHDVVPHVFKLPRKLDLLLRRRCYLTADGLIFHSATNLDQFKRTFASYPTNACVIPLGLVWHGPATESQMDEARRHLALPEERKVVLMFGQVRPNKGLHVLLDAFSQLVAEVPDAFLLIAGDVHPSVDVSRLQRKIQVLPLSSWRWDKRWIPDNELGRYFHAANIVVLPYTSFGSQSGVLTKAYAYGRPLVVTDVGSLGESVRADRSGFVVSPNDHHDLARAIVLLFSQSTMVREFEHNIAQVAEEKHSWENVARLTAEFYERVLGLS